MQRQIVGRRADFVERQQLDAEAGRHLRRDVRIVRDHAHAERARAPRHFLADPSEAGDAEDLAAKLGSDEFLLFPLPFLHRAVGRGHRSCQREHEGAGMLSDADAVRSRRIDDEDPARAGGVDVDVVDAGAGARDDAQTRRGIEQPRVDSGGAAHEQRVRVRKICRQRVGCPPRTRIYGPVGFRAKQFERRRRKFVGDHDFHFGRAGQAGRAGWSSR